MIKKQRKIQGVSKHAIVKDIKWISKFTGASENSIYISSYILTIHNIVEEFMGDFIQYINHNPIMDEDNFLDKILNRLSFIEKAKAIKKFIKHEIYKKLIDLNDLRNEYAHEIISVGRSSWKQISRKQMNKCQNDFIDIIKEIGKHREQAFKLTFPHC